MIYFDRDLSWLSFNYRVLQEANNKNVPIIERLKFLAIFSSNLDEFYRVRVAYHKNLLERNIKSKRDSVIDHKTLLNKIKIVVNKQLEEFGTIYRKVLLPELAENDIYIIDEKQVNASQLKFINNYFIKKILPELKVVLYKERDKEPYLENKKIYFAIKLKESNVVKKQRKIDFAIVNIPTDKVKRFLKLPSVRKKYVFIFIDDVMRLFMHTLFTGYTIEHCHSIKISRDAELFLEESENLIAEIKRKLIKQKTNPPARFLYDSAMPKELKRQLKNSIQPVKDYMIPGGKYHNFDDFINFKAPDNPNLRYPKLEALKNKGLEKKKPIFNLVSTCDHIVHFPYQTFNYVVNFLESAAEDPYVNKIKITIYRVAEDSRIVNALLTAARNGKKVYAFVEIKARFNEIANIYWLQQFLSAGIKVFFSIKKFKVHSKLCLIERLENKIIKKYAYLSTGNFNESTAKIYCDHGYFTSRKELTDDAEKIFDYFNNPTSKPKFKCFLVAPFNMREKLVELINKEIKFAKADKKAFIILKMNSLEDKKMINELYKASQAGVKISIIVRGICCLIPGIKGISENIKVISIVDQFLEHGRVFVFHNNGNDLVYVSSADLMSRSLNNRIESAFPLLDENSKKEIMHILKLQLKDNTKARKLNKTQSNPYKTSTCKTVVRAQIDTHEYLKQISE